MDNSYGFKDAAHSDAPIKARQIYLKGVLEGSQELIPRCGESGWSEDDGIPNPEALMINVKTKSSNTKKHRHGCRSSWCPFGIGLPHIALPRTLILEMPCEKVCELVCGTEDQGKSAQNHRIV